MKWIAFRRMKNKTTKAIIKNTKKHIVQENTFIFIKLKNAALIKKYGVEQDSHLSNTTYLAQL